jgi:hypothetical protein
MAALRCYVLMFHMHGERERRRFVRVADSSILDWIATGWEAFRAQRAWTTKLRDSEVRALETMFDAIYEELDDLADTPDFLEWIRQRWTADAEPHFFHWTTEPEDNRQIEYFVFDSELLRDARAALDRLPNPARARRDDGEVDRFGELIEKLQARPRATR